MKRWYLAVLAGCAFDPSGYAEDADSGNDVISDAARALTPDAALTVFDATAALDAPTTLDAAWTYDGFYGVEVTWKNNPGCYTWQTIELHDVDAGAGTAHYAATGVTADGTATADDVTVELGAISTGAVTIAAWVATQPTDGVLIGSYTSSGGCAFDVRLTR